MPFKLKTLNFNLPLGLGGISVEVGEAERVAAWRLYVELATRVSTQPLAPGKGSVREALSSLYALFAITREVLKEAGPDIGGHPKALGPAAILFLNERLRPFVEKWHSAYGEHESAEALRLARELGLPSLPVALVDQGGWDRVDEFYGELETMRKGLEAFVLILAKVCGVEQPTAEEVAVG